jgi:hypothetical protein
MLITTSSNANNEYYVGGNENNHQHKANSVDDTNRNDGQYEEVKVEDIEMFSPFRNKGKSESVHSVSYSENNGTNPHLQRVNNRRKSTENHLIKSNKTTSHHTIEKTNSDFFNLT